VQQSISDLVVALVGSTLFWVTISGIAIRALKVDFAKLESLLRQAYERTDQFTFNATHATRVVVLSTLRALYGRRFPRTLAVTCFTCLILNLYMIVLFHREWWQRKGQIAAVEASTIEYLSPDYSAIVNAPTADRDLSHAFEEISTREAVIYVNKDPADIRIRAVYDRFQPRIHDYALARNVGHDLLLARFFGDSYLYPSWRHKQLGQISALLLLVCFANGLLDAVAVWCTVSATVAAFRRRPWKVALWTVLVLSCFAISLLNYGQFVDGFEAELFSVVFWLFASASGVFILGFFAKSLTESVSRVAKFAIGMCGLAAAGALWFWRRDLPDFTEFDWWIIPRDFVVNTVHILQSGIDVHAVLVAMPTLFPFLLAISIFITLVIAKSIFSLTKIVLLGEVYGASVLSGSTYFIGFLTTLITSTTVGFLLMKWLSHLKR
jgi:hypothetical protein